MAGLRFIGLGYAPRVTEEPQPRPEQEGFGEASLGEAQSSDPPADPEMLEDVPEREEHPPGEDAEGGEESYGGDQDAEPSGAPDEVESDPERDQAEG